MSENVALVKGTKDPWDSKKSLPAFHNKKQFKGTELLCTSQLFLLQAVIQMTIWVMLTSHLSSVENWVMMIYFIDVSYFCMIILVQDTC